MDLLDHLSVRTDCVLPSDKDSLGHLYLVVHMDCLKRCIGGVLVVEDDRFDLESMVDVDRHIASEYRKSIEDMVEKDVLLV